MADKPTPASNTSELSRMLEGREADPVIYEGDIDQRMAALLKDHQEMGARPEQEPDNGDAVPVAAEAPADEPAAKPKRKKATTKKAAKKK